MMIKKYFKKKTKAGLTAYVMIMFGMIVMLYLFGFNSAWDHYHDRNISEEEGASQIDDAAAVDKGIGALIISNIKALFTNDQGDADILTIVVGTFVTLAGMYLASKVGGQYAFAYIIPIVFIIIFANIFIFPFENVASDISIGGVIPLEAILIVFFNLFLILGIVEFIRGGSM